MTLPKEMNLPSLIYCIYEIENIIILRKAIPLTTEVNIARISEYSTH